MSFKQKSKKRSFKTIFGVAALSLFTLGSATGLAFSSYQISQNTRFSNDFDEGRSIQLQFKLVDDLNKPVTDEKSQIAGLSKTTDAVISYLQSIGLTNVRVSYGFKYIDSTTTATVATDQKEKIGVVYASFEDSEKVFALEDIKEEINTFINNKKVYDKVVRPNNFQIELVKDRYGTTSGSSSNDTGRKIDGKSIIADDKGKVIDPQTSANITNNTLKKSNFFSLTSSNNQKSEFAVYKNPENKVQDSYVSADYNDHFYLKDFVEEYNANEKKRSEFKPTSSASLYNTTQTPTDPPPEETPTETYKDEIPKTTWIIWKNKSDFVNHLNELIAATYYNYYSTDGTVNKNNNTSQKPTDINVGVVNSEYGSLNYINKNTQENINKYLLSLSDIEKQYVQYMTVNKSSNPIIKSNDELMLNIKNFYVYLKQNETSSDGSTPNFNTTKDSWNFLTSDDTTLDSFWGEYILAKVDYKNYDQFFPTLEAPKKEDEENKDENKKPYPTKEIYNTNKFKTTLIRPTAAETANVYNNERYHFPIINSNLNSFYNESKLSISATPPNNTPRNIASYATGNVLTFDTLSRYIDQTKSSFKDQATKKTEYDKLKKQFDDQSQKPKQYVAKVVTQAEVDKAKKTYDDAKKKWDNETSILQNQFSSANVFMHQEKTEPNLNKSILGVSPYLSLLIVSAIVLFMIGIFVSIRYRVPGFLGFMSTALTFVISFLLFTDFGYVFSFFSFIALLASTMLSCLTPLFFFRNQRKEVSEGSSIYGASIKSIKKYWKNTLDAHAVTIIIALSFLFFGKLQNFDFGAMLIISGFLSLLFSGILFYILILFMVSIVKMDHYKYYMSTKKWNVLSSFFVSGTKIQTDLKYENNKLYVWYKTNLINRDYYSKWNYLFIGGAILVSVIGLILFGTIGTTNSEDFSGSYQVIVNNFSDFKKSGSDLLNQLGIVSQSHSIFNNQLIASTTTNVLSNSFIEGLKTKFSSTPNLLNSIVLSEVSSKAALILINNALICFGISLGFIAFWSLISLNIVAILPMLISQTIMLILFSGIGGYLRIPFDINSVAIILFMFVLNTIFNASVLSCIKSSWNRKQKISKIELIKLVNSIISKITKNYMGVILMSFIIFLSLMIFGSTSLIFVFALGLITLLLTIFFNNVILVNCWYLCVKFKDKYVHELHKTSAFNATKELNYDVVDEQLVKGLNW